MRHYLDATGITDANAFAAATGITDATGTKLNVKSKINKNKSVKDFDKIDLDIIADNLYNTLSIQDKAGISFIQNTIGFDYSPTKRVSKSPNKYNK
jgi:hypothetical protein